VTSKTHNITLPAWLSPGTILSAIGVVGTAGGVWIGVVAAQSVQSEKIKRNEADIVELRRDMREEMKLMREEQRLIATDVRAVRDAIIANRGGR